MDKRKIIIYNIILVTVFLVYSNNIVAMNSKVEITTGGTFFKFRKEVGKKLTKVVNAIDNKNFKKLKKYTTKSGFEDIKGIAKETDCYCVNPLYERRLIKISLNKFEVRDIKVKVDMNKTKGNPFQYIVFTLNQDAVITAARFAVDKHHYKNIIKKGKKLDDFTRRQKILHFIEIFRTAYNRKDLEYLEKVYSEDALIIVGKVLKKKKKSDDMLEGSSLSDKKVEFIKMSKNKYISHLKKVFKTNSFINVNFEKIKINKHPKVDDIYGVTLKQKWNSSTYSDTGYLFLMIDFMNPKKPIIHVRSWQPKKFQDGSIVSLGDFEIIE